LPQTDESLPPLTTWTVSERLRATTDRTR